MIKKLKIATAALFTLSFWLSPNATALPPAPGGYHFTADPHPPAIEPQVKLMDKKALDAASEITSKSIEFPIDSHSLLGSIEFSDEKLDQGLKPKVVILLDSSGSMGQVLDGKKSKMFYAKKLFGTYLADQWREKADVGMIAYGSRRKQDCEDTFFAVPVGERSLSKIDSAVKKLAPTGMTPIARSLQMAIDQLKGYPGPKRIMIFTDGEETCGGDSCKILEQAIQEKVFDLEMFVTGIGLREKSKDLDKLRCLGKTFGAPDSKSLQGALDSINTSISGKNAQGQPVSGNNLFVESPEPRAKVKLYRLEKGVKIFQSEFIANEGVKIPPGDYAAEVMLDPSYLFASFKVPPKKIVKLKVTGVGYLKVNFFNNLLDVEILNRDKKVTQSFVSDQWVPVKSGEYDIRIFGEPFFERYEKKYKIIPGKKQEIDLDNVGVVQIDYPKTVGLHVFKGSDKDIGSYLTNFPFLLRTGDYRFFVNEQCVIEGITVRREKSIQRLQCLPKR